MSLNRIYQQNENLEEQLSFWRLMESRERNKFVKKVKALLAEAKDFERSIASRSTKTQLQSIIDKWEDFLGYIENAPAHSLSVLSTSKRTSPVPDAIGTAKSSIKKSTPSFWVRRRLYTFFRILLNINRPISQPVNASKVDRNSPPSIPHDPKYRALYYKLQGTVDSEGDTK